MYDLPRRALLLAILVAACAAGLAVSAVPAAGQAPPRAAALRPSATPLAALTQRTEYDGAQALGLALRRLGTSKRVLMIAAHPDDENTALLATLALREGADVAYLSLTRGEGGQNGIGPELGTPLGLIRSEELLAARRLDGAEQYFTRAIDYGYSKNAQEAFGHWPKDSVLSDVVGVIRSYRPDVLLAVFSGTPRDGHGQHEVSGILAREAFDAAGDPSRFPEQLERGLRPHQPAKLYQSLWRGLPDDAYRLETGALDPLLGRSHFQIAMASRSRHRSQDMGRPEPVGPRVYGIALERTASGLQGGAALFAGLDTTLTARARAVVASPVPRAASGSRENGGAEPAGMPDLSRELGWYEGLAARAREMYNPLEPRAARERIARAIDHLRRADTFADASGAAELRFHIADELAEAQQALALAANVQLDAVASDDIVVPGQTFELELTLWNGGDAALPVHALEPALPAGWSTEAQEPAPAEVAPGDVAIRRFHVTPPLAAEPTRPYWLEQPPAGDLYRWPDDPSLRGLPFEPPAVQARAAVVVDGQAVEVARAADYRGADPREGEFRRPLLVLPAVGLTVSPGVLVLPLPPEQTSQVATIDAPPPGSLGEDNGLASPRPLRVTLRLRHEAPEATRGTLRLLPPRDWRVEPAATQLTFEGPGETRVVEATLRPPASATPGGYALRAVFESADGRVYDRGYRIIDYPHIRPRVMLHDAAVRVRAFDVAVPTELRVAYLMGAGDEGPDALRQLGIEPVMIGVSELAARDLRGFDAIVTGIRAYEVLPELAAQNRRLLDYVDAGGTLIVQYNKYEYFENGGFGPYPMTVARPHDRITDEASRVELLAPDHPALSWPNRIGVRDFEGWVQERSLYMPDTWDARYAPLLRMSDPGDPPEDGAVLVAPHGNGTYVYTGLSFFRQLPEGVPGAYRLFVNLLGLGARKAPVP